MKVFVIEEGENYEGSSIIGIFSTHEKALEYANYLYSEYPWRQNGVDHWTDDGCFYAVISEHEVR